MTSLLLQALPPADTVVTVAARDTMDMLFGAAAISAVVLAAVLLIGAISFFFAVRAGRKAVSDAMKTISADPGVQALRHVSENLSSMSDTVRGEVERLAGSLGTLSDRVAQASRRLEERIDELNALIEVAQGEAEGAFIESASRARGFRAGLNALGKEGEGGRTRGGRPEGEPPSGGAT